MLGCKSGPIIGLSIRRVIVTELKSATCAQMPEVKREKAIAMLMSELRGKDRNVMRVLYIFNFVSVRVRARAKNVYTSRWSFIDLLNQNSFFSFSRVNPRNPGFFLLFWLSLPLQFHLAGACLRSICLCNQAYLK